MARDIFADSYGQQSPYRDTPNQSRPPKPASTTPLQSAVTSPPPGPSQYPPSPSMQAWRQGPQKTGGHYGGYDNLDDFITGNWQIGYGNKPVDVQSWKNYMAKAGPEDYDYWGKRIQGWQAGGTDTATQGPYAGQDFGGHKGAGGNINPALLAAIAQRAQTQQEWGGGVPMYQQFAQQWLLGGQQ